MSRKQWGHGYYTGWNDGFDSGFSEGWDSNDDSGMGLAVAAGAALVGGVIGLIAGSSGRNKMDTYTCRRCGSDFSVPCGETPNGCPYCSRQDDYDDDDDDFDDEDW